MVFDDELSKANCLSQGLKMWAASISHHQYLMQSSCLKRHSHNRVIQVSPQGERKRRRTEKWSLSEMNDADSTLDDSMKTFVLR